LIQKMSPSMIVYLTSLTSLRDESTYNKMGSSAPTNVSRWSTTMFRFSVPSLRCALAADISFQQRHIDKHRHVLKAMNVLGKAMPQIPITRSASK
jgi:hypothetical protein